MKNGQQEQYTYWAFISYSHRDKPIASWMHGQLENYSIPRSLRKLRPSEKRLHPIFLDEAELAAGAVLSDQLQTALRQSRYLIVICSPHAVASDAVNQEIAYFKSLGRTNHVLCLVVYGEPNSTDSGQPNIECFPKALRYQVDEAGNISDVIVPIEDRPIAADIREGTRRSRSTARLKLVAALLEVPFGQVKKRQRNRYLALAGVSVALLATATAYWDAYYRRHVDFYKTYTRRQGIWEGWTI